MLNIYSVLASNTRMFTYNYPSVYVNQRPPVAGDDSSRGWAVGQFWQYNGSIWYADSVAVGAAVWTLQTPVASQVLDVVSGALGAYGVTKLRAAYAGFAFQIKRASDSATLDIGFVTGIADWASVDTFITATTGQISIWYDQSSNGYDLVPGGTNGPQIYSVMVGGLRSISFNGPMQTLYLKNTSMPITNVRNVSILTVGTSGFANNASILYELGNPTAKLTTYVFDNQGLTFSGHNGVSCPQAMLHVTNGASNQFLYQNDITGTGSATPTSSAATGITLANGTPYSVNPGCVDVLAFIIYDSTLSAANQKLLLQAAYTFSGVQPQAHDEFTWVGDSITQSNSMSAGATNSTGYVRVAEGLTTRPFTYYNCGVGGQLASGAATESSSVSARSFRANCRNYVSIFIGTNDLAGATAPSTVYNSIKSIISAYRTAGFTKVAVCTILPRGTGFSGGQTANGFETDRLALNVLIVAGLGVDYDYLCDVGADPIIGNKNIYLTPTYSFDNVHPTPAGAAIIATVVANGIAPMVI